MSYRFRYIDWRGAEVEIHTLEQLQQHVRLQWISPMTLLHDALTGEWAPAQAHTIYQLITDPNVEIRDYVPHIWPEECPAEGASAKAAGPEQVEPEPEEVEPEEVEPVSVGPADLESVETALLEAELEAAAQDLPDFSLDGPALTLELPEDTPSPEDVIRELMEERERDRELPSEEFVTLNTSQHVRQWSDDRDAGPGEEARERRGPTTDQRLRPRERWTVPAEMQALNVGRKSDPRLRMPFGEAPVADSARRASSGVEVQTHTTTVGRTRWLLLVSAVAAVAFALAALFTAFGQEGPGELEPPGSSISGLDGAPLGGEGVQVASLAVPFTAPSWSTEAAAYGDLLGSVDSALRVNRLDRIPVTWLQEGYVASPGRYPEVRAYWAGLGEMAGGMRAMEDQLFRASLLRRLRAEGVSGTLLSLRVARAQGPFEATRPGRERVYGRLEALATAAMELHDALEARSAVAVSGPSPEVGTASAVEFFLDRIAIHAAALAEDIRVPGALGEAVEVQLRATSPIGWGGALKAGE